MSRFIEVYRKELSNEKARTLIRVEDIEGVFENNFNKGINIKLKYREEEITVFADYEEIRNLEYFVHSNKIGKLKKEDPNYSPDEPSNPEDSKK